MPKLQLLLPVLLVCFSLFQKSNANAQSCAGSWALNRPLTSQCVTGQWVGWQNNGSPSDCPINPSYIGTQTNTFYFTNPVNSFFIDFRGTDGPPGCARIEVKVNDIFYPLSTANLIEIPAGHTCTSGSFSYITLTDDGYITISPTGGSSLIGFGRIIIAHPNTNSVTVSTNDGSGTIFSNPFNCDAVVPLELESFIGVANNCTVLLNWKSGLEVNVQNIEVQQSFDQTNFITVAEEIAKGSNSSYTIELTQTFDAFYRLKINDWDNTYQYSEIIYVRSICNYPLYKIYPNPAASNIFISNLRTGDQVKILDMQGRQMLNTFVYQLNNNINVSMLSIGMYILQIIHEGKIVECLKLMKR